MLSSHIDPTPDGWSPLSRQHPKIVRCPSSVALRKRVAMCTRPDKVVLDRYKLAKIVAPNQKRVRGKSRWRIGFQVGTYRTYNRSIIEVCRFTLMIYMWLCQRVNGMGPHIPFSKTWFITERRAEDARHVKQLREVPALMQKSRENRRTLGEDHSSLRTPPLNPTLPQRFRLRHERRATGREEKKKQTTHTRVKTCYS